MKSKKPIIGITCGEVRNTVEPWASVVYGQSTTYSDAVIHAGGIPIILPITRDEPVLRVLYEQCDGLLFAGGNDIDPQRYGEAAGPETNYLSQQRDDQEWTLLDWTLTDGKPALAICRGMQLLNVFRGGSLYQHIPTDLPQAQNHTASREHQDTTYIAHQLKLEPESRLASIVGAKPLGANSQHHQAVHTLGKDLTATAWAEDGVIEAIELSGEQFLIAIQPHPEGLESETEPRWRKLFEAFVTASAGRA